MDRDKPPRKGCKVCPTCGHQWNGKFKKQESDTVWRRNGVFLIFLENFECIFCTVKKFWWKNSTFRPRRYSFDERTCLANKKNLTFLLDPRYVNL